MGWKRSNNSFSIEANEKGHYEGAYLLKLSRSLESEILIYLPFKNVLQMLNGFKSFYTSLDMFFIVIVADHRHESF